MHQFRMFMGGTLALVLVGLSATDALAGGIENTLNFQNVTASRIDQNVAETASNEKEVDFGDFDNDGDMDVVIGVAYSDFDQRRNKLYRNDAGVFNEVSGAPVIPGFSDTDVTRNAFFQDYNADGWLDIIVINDANTGGQAGRTKIYMNQHPGGVFSSYTEEGVARLGAGTGGAACSGVSLNVDGANGPDLYVGNYPGPSQDTMYLNNGSGFFTAVTATHVPVDGDYTVDVASADMNGDGKVDLLIANQGPNYLYYNHKNNAGSALGDFNYVGSTQSLGDASASENAMEPGDFDNDGDQDFYWSNRAAGGGDRIYENTGNNGSNNAVFAEMPAATLPSSVTTVTSRKATVADLDDDGRVDIFVMKEAGTSSRPTILRNTSVNGDISFVDWTPATAFPNGSTHQGWHAAAFHSNADGDLDIFIGGWLNDHLFEQVPSDEATSAAAAQTILNSIYNDNPLAYDASTDGHPVTLEVLGRGTAPASATDGTDALGSGEDNATSLQPINLNGGGSITMNLPSIPNDGFVSIILRPAPGYDYRLDVKQGAATIASSDRGAADVEEALMLIGSAVPDGALTVDVVYLSGIPVPTVTEWGMATMGLLLVIAGTIVFKGRTRVAA